MANNYQIQVGLSINTAQSDAQIRKKIEEYQQQLNKNLGIQTEVNKASREQISYINNQIKLANSLGQSLGKVKLNLGNPEELKQQVNGLLNVKDASVKLGGVVEKNREQFQKLTVEVNKGNGTMQQYSLFIDKATGETFKLDNGLRTMTRTTMSFGQNFANITKKFAEWILVGAVVMTPIKAMQDATKYVIQMDTALTNLSKVVNLTTSELNDMKKASIDLGRELGKSSVDIMKSMAEFGRVTKNTDEIKELAKVAVMASNVTTLTAADAAKDLNSTMIAFKLNAKDAMMVLDQWNEIQNNFRVSAEDLAGSIEVVGSAAKQAGVEISQLNGLTTAIVSSTGVTGNEAGTAIKSMLSRIYRIGKDGAEDAGKTEEMLNKVGIAVRKSKTEFRDLTDILNDVKAKWSEMNGAEQMSIAQQIGGKRIYATLCSNA